MRRLTAGLALALALGLVACDSTTSPEALSSDATSTTVGVSLVDAALTQNSQSGIERAEFRDGFCAVFFTDIFTLYTGASQAVTTKSGNINYSCKGDIAFGPGPDFQVRLRGITFFDFSPADGVWLIEPCDINVTPGVAGRLQVSCHVGPRGGQAFDPEA